MSGFEPTPERFPGTAPDVDPELVELATRAARQRLGTAFAQKASGPFLAASYLALEGGTRAPLGAMAFSEALTPSAPAELRGVVEFATGEVSPTDGDRAARIRRVRTDAYHRLGPAYEELERLVDGPLRTEAAAPGRRRSATRLTQVCWLNGTIRSHADPRAFAEIAADDAVVSIDAPRPLVADALDDLLVALGVVEHRRRAEHGGRGEGIDVAVIDSEVALRHPALAGRVVLRRNYTDEGWSNPGDHGTAVAGFIGGDDGAGYEGVAPGVEIYSYKVLANSPSLQGDDFDGALAIQQALEDGIDVANCSWGAGPAGSGLGREARALDSAWALGLVVVKSAGNRGPGASTMTTPADAAGGIVVGATDLSGAAMADYSSRGPTGPGRRPGPDVVARVGDRGHDQGLVGCVAGGGYADGHYGTSFAAPQVAGLAALLLEDDPTLEPDDVRSALVGAAAPLPGEGPDAQGAGLARMP